MGYIGFTQRPGWSEISMDMDLARHNMVEQQIKPHSVLNPKILHLLESLHRENFVPMAYQQIAYADTSVPLGNNRILLPPDIIGRLLEALRFNGSEQVLEIGTGTGYLTALLARLSQHVTSVEVLKPLALQANRNLLDLGIKNYEIITGNALEVLKGSKAFDVIVLTGSITYLPKRLSNHLKYGGKLFAVLGHDPIMQACIFTRINEGEWSKTTLFETVVPPLKEIIDVTTFEF